jgi:phenylacetate-CoA ligase
LRRTFYRAIERRTYAGSSAILKQFKSFEFAPRTEVETYQLQKLRSILQHAYQNVPYYKNLFRGLGFDPENARLPEEMIRIPVLTKALLRSHSQELLARNIDARRLMQNASGGSTGKPVEFYQTKEYWVTAYASRSMFLSWWGVAPGEPMASIWGADRDTPDWSWRERLYHKMCQVRICNAFALSADRMERFAAALQEWQPRFINGYATALEGFARFLLERGKLEIRPVAVESTAETLTDSQRALIEKAFDSPVYNFYGSREVNNLAAECEMHRGLHTNQLTRYIEIVDDDGRECRAGVPGRILVTDLSNPAMPLIRYENEDIGSWSDVACPCGRPFRLIEKVWGRSSDFITTLTGKLIHGEYFTHLFYHLPGVNTFQVFQRSPTEVFVSIVLQPGAEDLQLGPLRENMSKALGEGMRCEINIVDNIPRTPSGKHRFTLSAVQVSWSATGAQS